MYHHVQVNVDLRQSGWLTVVSIWTMRRDYTHRCISQGTERYTLAHAGQCP